MRVFCQPPNEGRCHPFTQRRHARRRGFTLVEIMISLAVLAVGTMGGVSAFMILNRYAANLRNLATARALCQERIEQALTLRFVPSSGTVPAAPSADPSQPVNSTCTILGPSTSFSSAGAFTSGANFQTSNENIPVYTQSDGTSANNSANVTYNRVTTVSPAANVSTLNLLVFNVTVSYVFHGQPYSATMSTMRGSD